MISIGNLTNVIQKDDTPYLLELEALALEAGCLIVCLLKKVEFVFIQIGSNNCVWPCKELQPGTNITFNNNNNRKLVSVRVHKSVRCWIEVWADSYIPSRALIISGELLRVEVRTLFWEERGAALSATHDIHVVVFRPGVVTTRLSACGSFPAISQPIRR